MKNKDPLNDLMAMYDNLSHCARELGVTRQDIYYWQKIGYIPHCRGALIEEKTKGKIKASSVWQVAGTRRQAVK